MKTKNELIIEQYIVDIGKIYPGKLLLTKAELARIRNTSESTINREKKRAEGVAYKHQGGRILYPVRSIAEWLAKTIKTY